MKTKFFRKNIVVQTPKLGVSICLLLLFLWPMALSAQNGVTVSNLVMDAGTVTFNVSWKNTGMPAIWSDTVWVWVDYNTAGTMTRLPLSAGATLTTHTAPDDVGKVMEVSGNNKGVWVVGNARSAGSFSATVRLLTATSTAAAACVYASNYPPVGQYTTATNISFRGTRPYDVVLQPASGSSTVTQVAGGSYSIPAGYTLQSFTDKTGAPGVITCAASAVYDLRASAAAFCTGATVTFALSNTAAGRTYQLYKGSDLVNTLTGTGSAATFTGAFAGAGVYTAQVAADGGYCAAAMTGTHPVSENAVPATPAVTASSRCGSGTVMLMASSSGAVIDWYSAASGGSLLLSGNNTYTMPSISTSTTYYAQARNTTTNCISAARTAVLATVNTVPATPTVTRSAATVCQGTNVVFTASGGGTGATYTWSGNPTGTASGTGNATYTVSGSSTGTKSVTAVAANASCTGTRSSTVTAYVAAIPATPTVTRSAATVCEGTNVVFTAFGGGSGATYTWSGNPTGTASGTGNGTYTVSGASTGTKSVTAVAANASCTGARSSTVTAYVMAPAGNGQAANSCGCATGTTNCTGTCRTDNDYTTNDGVCTGQCNRAYVQLRNVCGSVINSTYSTYSEPNCKTPYTTSNDGSCTGACHTAYVRQKDCNGNVVNAQYGTYTDNNCTGGCRHRYWECAYTYDANCPDIPSCRDYANEYASCLANCAVAGGQVDGFYQFSYHCQTGTELLLGLVCSCLVP